MAKCAECGAEDAGWSQDFLKLLCKKCHLGKYEQRLPRGSKQVSEPDQKIVIDNPGNFTYNG